MRRYGRPRASTRYRARRSAAKFRSTGPRNGIQGRKHVAKLRYSDSLTNLVDEVSKFETVFSCNNLYDPDTESTGHQPYYFDTLSTLYRNFSVLSSRIVIRATARPGLTVPILVYARKVDNIVDVTPSTDVRVIRESLGCRHRALTSQNPNCVLSMNWSCKEGMSRTNNIGTCGNIGSGGGPELERYFQFGFITASGQTVDANDIQFDILITYKALFTGARDMALS